MALITWPATHADTLPGTSFSKIANDGSVLSVEAAPGSGRENWACLRDDSTGLVWELKTTEQTLRHRGWTFTPYDGNPATNGGYPGYKDGTSGDCRRDLMTEASCNTEAYIAAVNRHRLCGFDDWRLPTVRELVAVSGQTTDEDPAAATLLLPNTESGWYWTGIEKIGVTNFSRVILLPPGGQPTFYDGSYLVMAVRGPTREALQ